MLPENGKAQLRFPIFFVKAHVFMRLKNTMFLCVSKILDGSAQRGALHAPVYRMYVNGRLQRQIGFAFDAFCVKMTEVRRRERREEVSGPRPIERLA